MTDRRTRDLSRTIQRLCKGTGIDVDGPDYTGGTHMRFCLRKGSECRHITTSLSPRCLETALRKTRSKARRAIQELQSGTQ